MATFILGFVLGNVFAYLFLYRPAMKLCREYEERLEARCKRLIDRCG